jgi:hypothetical protein
VENVTDTVTHHNPTLHHLGQIRALRPAAKHTVPDGKFVKVACVHKSVPRIIKARANLLLRDGHRDAGVRALQGPEGSEGYLMIAAIYLVMDEGRPMTAFTSKGELIAFLRRGFGCSAIP